MESAATVTGASERRRLRRRRVGRQTVSVVKGPLSAEAILWVAVFEGGPRAFLGGGSSLIAGGPRQFTMQRVRVSVPRGAPLRRSRNDVAAVRHALWGACSSTPCCSTCSAEWKLVVEVDGIQHTWASEIVGDAIRQNDLSLQDSTVLRLPLQGLRVAPDDFFAQIEQALVAAGCVLPRRRTA